MGEEKIARRIFVGGLFQGITDQDLNDRFSRFGNVTAVDIRARKDNLGNVLKTFGYLNMDISDKDYKKCMATFNKTKWRGNEMQIQIAKESFLDRLAKEREEAKTKGTVKEPTSEPFNLLVKGAPPGTAVEGKTGWVVGKYGRALPVVEIRTKNKKKVVKVDPSKYVHGVKKLDTAKKAEKADSEHDTSINELTWHMNVDETENLKKIKGEFPPKKRTPHKPKQRPESESMKEHSSTPTMNEGNRPEMAYHSNSDSCDSDQEMIPSVRDIKSPRLNIDEDHKKEAGNVSSSPVVLVNKAKRKRTISGTSTPSGKSILLEKVASPDVSMIEMQSNGASTKTPPPNATSILAQLKLNSRKKEKSTVKESSMKKINNLQSPENEMRNSQSTDSRDGKTAQVTSKKRKSVSTDKCDDSSNSKSQSSSEDVSQELVKKSPNKSKIITSPSSDNSQPVNISKAQKKTDTSQIAMQPNLDEKVQEQSAKKGKKVKQQKRTPAATNVKVIHFDVDIGVEDDEEMGSTPAKTRKLQPQRSLTSAQPTFAQLGSVDEFGVGMIVDGSAPQLTQDEIKWNRYNSGGFGSDEDLLDAAQEGRFKKLDRIAKVAELRQKHIEVPSVSAPSMKNSGVLKEYNSDTDNDDTPQQVQSQPKRVKRESLESHVKSTPPVQVKNVKSKSATKTKKEKLVNSQEDDEISTDEESILKKAEAILKKRLAAKKQMQAQETSEDEDNFTECRSLLSAAKLQVEEKSSDESSMSSSDTQRESDQLKPGMVKIAETGTERQPVHASGKMSDKILKVTKQGVSSSSESGSSSESEAEEVVQMSSAAKIKNNGLVNDELRQKEKTPDSSSESSSSEGENETEEENQSAQQSKTSGTVSTTRKQDASSSSESDSESEEVVQKSSSVKSKGSSLLNDKPSQEEKIPDSSSESSSSEEENETEEEKQPAQTTKTSGAVSKVKKQEASSSSESDSESEEVVQKSSAVKSKVSLVNDKSSQEEKTPDSSSESSSSEEENEIEEENQPTQTTKTSGAVSKVKEQEASSSSESDSSSGSESEEAVRKSSPAKTTADISPNNRSRHEEETSSEGENDTVKQKPDHKQEKVSRLNSKSNKSESSESSDSDTSDASTKGTSKKTVQVKPPMSAASKHETKQVDIAENKEKTKKPKQKTKFQDSNQMRLESLKQRSQEAWAQKNLLKQALAAVDSNSSKSKKIIFDSESEDEKMKTDESSSSSDSDSGNDSDTESSDDESVQKITKKKDAKNLTDKRPLLFDGDSSESENEDEDQFRVRPEYEGKAGSKLIAMQSRFGNDARFKFTKKFLDSDDEKESGAESSGAEEEEEEEMEVTEETSAAERDRALNILNQVVGLPAGKVPKKKNVGLFKDMATRQYDPTKDDHKQFEIAVEKKEKKKKLKGVEVSAEAEPVPEVSSERFFEVQTSLKGMFSQQEEKPFSLLAMLGREDDDSSKVTIQQDDGKGQSIGKVKSPWHQQFGSDNSSDDEQEDMDTGPVDTSTKEPGLKSSAGKKIRIGTASHGFFFVDNDARIADGVDFFHRQGDLENIRESWAAGRQELVEAYRNKRKRFKFMKKDTNTNHRTTFKQRRAKRGRR